MPGAVLVDGVQEEDGDRVDFADARDALDKRISIVYQELNLIPFLSVAENIFLGREPQPEELSETLEVEVKRDGKVRFLEVKSTTVPVPGDHQVHPGQPFVKTQCIQHQFDPAAQQLEVILGEPHVFHPLEQRSKTGEYRIACLMPAVVRISTKVVVELRRTLMQPPLKVQLGHRELILVGKQNPFSGATKRRRHFLL